MLIFVWLLSMLKVIISSISLISCPSCVMYYANFDLPSAYMKPFLCSLNLVMKFLFFFLLYVEVVTVFAVQFVQCFPMCWIFHFVAIEFLT